jgi:hypothetical protein
MFSIESLAKVVILVKTGIQFLDCPREFLDSRLRGNDDQLSVQTFARDSL